MFIVSKNVQIPFSEILISAIRSKGPGGQHVNKTSSAIQLQWDIANSTIPDEIIPILLKQSDKRLSRDGVLTITSQNHRSQRRNRLEAFDRLKAFVNRALKPKKPRRPTRPTKASKLKRLEQKKQQSERKKTRKKVDF